MSSRALGPIDTGFLFAETRETPMHVGSLMPFTPPADVEHDGMRRLMDEIREAAVYPPWNLKLQTPWFRYNPMQRWVEDRDFDISYHVRRIAVPAPGDERELGILMERLHSNELDLGKPLWEMYLVEGLEGGRFAFYVKLHHALIDGFTGMKLLGESLSTDPDARDMPMFFSRSRPGRRKGRDDSGLWADLGTPLRTTVGSAGSALDVGRALTRLTLRRGEYGHLVASLQAPTTIFNRRITRNRRFATQRYPLPRLKELAKASGATLNDVVLAVCGGGLRRYLAELDELPSKPLVAFVPVNVRPRDDPGGGVAVGAMLASLGTHLADPVARLQAVSASTSQAKRNLEGMSRNAMLAYSAALMAPFTLQSLTAMGRVPNPMPVTFNVTISNVPGPPAPLYFRGARMEAAYPMSIPGHGLALNITIQSYADTLDFGFIGCRDTVPSLQRLAVHTGDALAELEAALPASKPRRRRAAP